MSAAPSLVERLAGLFRSRPGVWIDGRALAPIAGAYAWRSRISDLRRAPFRMRIDNRQRRVRHDGRAIVVSEYRFVSSAPASSPAVVDVGAAVRGRDL